MAPLSNCKQNVNRMHASLWNYIKRKNPTPLPFRHEKLQGFRRKTGAQNYSLQSAVCSLRSAVCGLRSVVCGLRSAVCGLRSAVCKFQTNETSSERAVTGVQPVPMCVQQCVFRLLEAKTEEKACNQIDSDSD